MSNQLHAITKRGELPKLFNDSGFTIGAEIGVERGKFSEELCIGNQNLITLYCIDPWIPYKGNRRGGGEDKQRSSFEEAVERLSKHPVKMIRKKSMDAVKDFEDNSLDFVYIDGNHDFDYVMQDIIEWSKKVRPGGIVAGHDYYHFHNSGVIEAVDAYILAHGIRHWYLTDERMPTFFWVKQEKEMTKRIKDW